MNRETRRDLLVFVSLLAFGVAGRWAAPAWNFTPLATVTALAAWYYRSLLPALVLPSALLAITDLALPSHNSGLVQLSVHAMAIVPLLLGRAARRSEGWRRVACWGLCGVVPATAFFLVTNLAVWASRSLYPATLGGLIECYVQALPFYRTMLAGDVCYMALATACLAAAYAFGPRAAAAPARINRAAR
jgi:hypothetical protein